MAARSLRRNDRVHTSHDPSHWTIAQCVGVYPKHAAAAIGAAGWGTRQPTECPSPPPTVRQQQEDIQAGLVDYQAMPPYPPRPRPPS